MTDGNQAFILILLAALATMEVTLCDAIALDDVTLHVTAPEEVHSDAHSVTLQLAAGGDDVDKITKVVWNFSYYKFYERNTDPYDYMEPVTLSGVSDLVVTKEGGGVSISEMERLCRAHGTLREGETGEDILVLHFSIIVEAFAGGEIIGRSPLLDAGFDFIVPRDLTLTLSGPDGIRTDDDKATFALTLSGKDLGRIEEVGWFFEYHTDAEWAQDIFGGWLIIPGQGMFGMVRPVSSTSFQLKDKEGPLNLSYLREFAESQGSDGTLQMRVYVKAYIANHAPLAKSDPHEFLVLGGDTFTLQYYDPFYGMEEAFGPISIRARDTSTRGNLEAKLVDKQGKGVPGRLVHFYVEPSGSSALDDVMNTPPITPEWILISSKLGIGKETWLGSAMTTTGGKATINLIELNCFNAEMISKELLKNGKVEGTIKAIIANEQDLQSRIPPEIEHQAAAQAGFDCIARIVGVAGEGRSDEFKQAYLKENPEDTWGTGKVRVKRIIGKPNFDYTPADRGFKIMAGDILDIDGNVEVTIAWVTGDVALIKVPHKHQFKGSQNLVEHVRVPMLRNAYESGFQSGIEEAASTLIGFGVENAVKALIATIPGSSQVGMCVDLLKKFKKEVDFSKIEEFARVRVRSTLIIDWTGDDVKIYTIEGNPQIKTFTGEEVTLEDMESVTLTENGVISLVNTIEPEKDLEEWSEHLEVEETPSMLAMLAPVLAQPIIGILRSKKIKRKDRE